MIADDDWIRLGALRDEQIHHRIAGRNRQRPAQRYESGVASLRIGIQRLVVSHVKRPDSVRIGALKDGQVGDVGRSWRGRLEIVRGSTEIGWFVGSSDNLRI